MLGCRARLEPGHDLTLIPQPELCTRTPPCRWLDSGITWEGWGCAKNLGYASLLHFLSRFAV